MFSLKKTGTDISWRSVFNVLLNLEYEINIFQQNMKLGFGESLNRESTFSNKGLNAIYDFWNFGTKKPRNFETKNFWNRETQKLRNQETKKPRNFETKKPRTPYPSTYRPPPLHPTIDIYGFLSMGICGFSMDNLQIAWEFPLIAIDIYGFLSMGHQ